MVWLDVLTKPWQDNLRHVAFQTRPPKCGNIVPQGPNNPSALK